MKLTSMQKMLAVVAAMVLGVVIVVALLILPKAGELSQLEADRQAAEQEVAQTRALLAQLQQAKSGAAVTQAALLRIANEFPESPDLPSLIIELQDVSNASGVRFNRVTPGEPVAPAGSQYMEVPMKIALVGGWSDILDYLRRLNRMTRAVRVTSINLIPVTEGVSPTSTVAPDLTANLDLKAYVMSPVTAPAGVGATATVAPVPTQ